MKRIILTVMTAMLLGGNVAWADNLEDAVAAYKRKDYATALKMWRQLAAQGNASAQASLGALYANGQSVPQDDVKARQWFDQAGAQGDASAQYNLGQLYAKGLGVPQDYGKSRQWYEQAADQGSAWAQHNLGWLYAEGHGVSQDDMRAYMWYSLAAPHLTSDVQKLAADDRDKVVRSMTPAKIAEAQRLSRQCLAQQFKGC